MGGTLGFSVPEMHRRRAAFGRELERRGLSHALVYGANRSGSAVMWLTGWPVTREALLVVAPEQDDDVLLVSFFNHVPQARRLSPTGELLLVTDHGPQRLHAYPQGLHQVS